VTPGILHGVCQEHRNIVLLELRLQVIHLVHEVFGKLPLQTFFPCVKVDLEPTVAHYIVAGRGQVFFQGIIDVKGNHIIVPGDSFGPRVFQP